MGTSSYAPIDGQTSATLDTTNLSVGTYICKATWNKGTPDNSADDYTLTSAEVTLQYHNVTFDYGTLGKDTKNVMTSNTVTPPSPVFAGKVLVGWYTTNSFTTEFDFDTPITADTTVYAKFDAAVERIEKTGTSGQVDTYTIIFTDGSTKTFEIVNDASGQTAEFRAEGDKLRWKYTTDATWSDLINLADLKGQDGVDGKDGTNGVDGQTPYIGENGNWWIGDTDTGVKAAGEDGKDSTTVIALIVGSAALTSNIALIAFVFVPKKRLF